MEIANFAGSIFTMVVVVGTVFYFLRRAVFGPQKWLARVTIAFGVIAGLLRVLFGPSSVGEMGAANVALSIAAALGIIYFAVDFIGDIQKARNAKQPE